MFVNIENCIGFSAISLSTILLYSLISYDGNIVFAEPEKYHFALKLGSNGSGDGESITPHTIAFDLSGNMYVTDTKMLGYKNSTATVHSSQNGASMVLPMDNSWNWKILK